MNGKIFSIPLALKRQQKIPVFFQIEQKIRKISLLGPIHYKPELT